jgi:outer membrane murein-binding lipoprotein Lpp
MKTHYLLPLLACVLVGCEDNQAMMSDLESKIGELESDVQKLKSSASKLRADFRAVSDAKLAAEESADDLTETLAAVKQQVAAMQSQFSSYKADYRQAMISKAVGSEIPELMVGARIFKKVKINKLTQWELAFTHSEGSIRAMLSDLPKDLQERFGYDPNAGPMPDKGLGLNPQLLAKALAEAERLAATESAYSSTSTASASPTGGGGGGDSVMSSSSLGDGKTLEVLSNGRKLLRSADGTAVELLSDFSSGSSSSGKKPGPPPGYKPIGSNFTGSSLGR